MCIYLPMNRNLSRYRLFAMTAVLPWNIQSYEQEEKRPPPHIPNYVLDVPSNSAFSAFPILAPRR